MVAALFLPFKWVRAGLGVVVGLGVAWLTGRYTMYYVMKEKLEVERAKRKVRVEEGTRGWWQ